MNDYWYKQTSDEPLFPDLIWSRPENKQQAGKLGIVGGNQFGFVAPGQAFQVAEKTGIGIARLLLPDSLKPFVGAGFTEGFLAPSTPSGSLSRQALGDFLELAQWADGVLIAGDLGRNSETAILLEQAVIAYRGQLTVTQDAVDYFITNPQAILSRSDSLLVLSFAQLQKLASHAHFPQAFTFDMTILRLVELLHAFTQAHPLAIITKHHDNLFVAVNGQVSSTKLSEDLKVWRVQTAAKASVWWLQNPGKTFETLTTAMLAK